MSGIEHDITEKFRQDCLTLEEQVRVLVKTEIQLRRTKAELTQSKRKIEAYNRTLEQKVEERTKELLIINEKLRQEIRERERAEKELKQTEDSLRRAERMEAVSLLAGSVAHDLNNLLTSIIGFPSLLLRKIPQDHPMRPSLNSIKKCGEKAADVVRDLSTLSKRGVVNTASIQLNDIFNTILSSPEFSRMRNDAPGVKVNSITDSPIFTISGSPVDIYNVIIHMLSNAFESMPHGGILTMSTENVYLDTPKSGYETIDAGEYVTVTVSDTGTGIEHKHLDKIFEPFYSRKVMGKKGTGLGMAIVWGIVKIHKGYIDIVSAEKKGTTITLYFRATRKLFSPGKEPLNPDDYRGNKESILIVDDADNQREICTEMVAELGYRPASVANGEEAIAYLKDKKVDLLILDMIMEPGLNGLETYRTILEQYPGQKAVIVSGFCENDQVEEAQILGAGSFVRKPYTLETLGKAIKKELSVSIGRK